MYLVVVQDNRPEEILGQMREAGLKAEVRTSVRAESSSHGVVCGFGVGGWTVHGTGRSDVDSVVYEHSPPTGAALPQGPERGALDPEVYQALIERRRRVMLLGWVGCK